MKNKLMNEIANIDLSVYRNIRQTESIEDRAETKKKPSFVPFDQFLEENCIVRGQE